MRAVFFFLNALLLNSLLNSAIANERKNVVTKDRSQSALTHPYASLSDEASDQFVLGRSFFHIPWVEAPAATTARDGLGPMFNANTCASCHRNNGGGVAITQNGTVDRSIIVKLAHRFTPKSNKKPQAGFKTDATYGGQLSINGNNDVPFEGRLEARIIKSKLTYEDGTTVVLSKPEFSIKDMNYGPLEVETRMNPLRALPLIGLGLIEDIPVQQIESFQDEFDDNKDGISGRINQVWSVKDQQYKTGRYGWKATTATVIEQTANALINDMGLTTDWFKDENCTQVQTACRAAYQSAGPDVPMNRLLAIKEYMTHLRKPREAQNINPKGRLLFQSLGCGSCHRNGYRTNDGITVNPYSDFLLHDMGPDLKGGSTMFQAAAEEWRTPPLWGIGLAKTLNPKAGYLHDGRASTLEQAILWHGGEAKRVRQNFAKLNQQDRDILLNFLNSL